MFISLRCALRFSHLSFYKLGFYLLAIPLYVPLLSTPLQGHDKEEIYRRLTTQVTEMIFTAHPTEVNRRTLILKQNALIKLLMEKERSDLTQHEIKLIDSEIQRAVSSIWQTDELRRTKPTPQDEAKGGLYVVENVLWDAVPTFMKKLDVDVERTLGKKLPADLCIVKFGSWMGGDRDGNPNVTAAVTKDVNLMHQWMAFKLYEGELEKLKVELSISAQYATKEFRSHVGESEIEPYRKHIGGILKKVQNSFNNVIAEIEKRPLADVPVYTSKVDLMRDVKLCYDSLIATGNESLADGRLRDLIRRIACFGIHMTPLDVRQESTLHMQAVDAITRHLGIGEYASWSEEEKQTFLINELKSKRPLIPMHFLDSEDCNSTVRETLKTFQTISEIGSEAVGAYIISMAKKPSDVLAVQLLQKEMGMTFKMRVVPLFETLDDLQASAHTMTTLFNMPWYLNHINGFQEIMVGYSDSGKDAGRLAAGWALFQGQQNLVKVCEEKGVKLCLFHGRGGSVSRGGGTQGRGTYKAILSQPEGTVNGHFRVTEQGEVITAQFGSRAIAERTFDIYTSSVLMEAFDPKITPQKEWVDIMNKLSTISCDSYRNIVVNDKRFIPYFRQATPEVELGGLNIGSRPARRPSGINDGVSSLRAIPWVFAWTQTRSFLPSWLGIGDAINTVLLSNRSTLKDMYGKWPFFRELLELVDTVIGQAEPHITANYDKQLVPAGAVQELGKELRHKFEDTKNAIKELSGKSNPIAGDVVLGRALEVRNPYVDPLNVLQAEILKRTRDTTLSAAEREIVKDALLITMNGISAGMRTTG